MQLVWLHGAPAAGKLTVAKTLQKNYGFKLFHNHLAVDISLAIYDEFGEKDFFDFTNAIRRKVLSKAKSLGVKKLAMTYMTCAEDDHEEIERYLEFFEGEGIEVFPVHLCPERHVLKHRVVTQERHDSHKISCIDQLSGVLAELKFLPITHKNGLAIDNTALSPEDTAQQIVEYLARHTETTA